MRTVTPRIKPDKWSRHISSWIYRPRPQLHKPTNALKCTNHPMNNAQTIQCTNHPIQEKNPNSWLLQAFWFSATVTCKFCCPNFVGFPLFSQQILLGPHCHLIFGLHEGFPQNESCWVLFFSAVSDVHQSWNGLTKILVTGRWKTVGFGARSRTIWMVFSSRPSSPGLWSSPWPSWVPRGRSTQGFPTWTQSSGGSDLSTSKYSCRHPWAFKSIQNKIQTNPNNKTNSPSPQTF